MSPYNKFCYIPFHGFCITPYGHLSYCCMDYTLENFEHLPRVYKPVHIDEVEDLQEWWQKTYEPVWDTYLQDKQHSINPCFKCFGKEAEKKRPVKESYDANLKNGLVK